ncbi:MAG: SMC family ATPase, partial [Spirochaetales bacterium]|nr:SMC family ATPase [Spirochaetales bacterium]
MRPLRLEFEHFGPYPSIQIIDFSELDDFFLIFGKTGSGKTTIFDAMTYALFGEAPGARSRLDRELRSRFSPEDCTPWVSFEFEASDGRWKVYRTLLAIRRKRDGTATEKSAEVTLYRFREATGDYEVVTDRIREANDRLKEILHLSAEEFSKIVLLPQGEFQKFLEMNSTERVAILEKLFDVSMYDAVSIRALEEARKLEAMLDQVRREVQRLQENVGESPGQQLESIDTEIKSLAEACAAREQQAHHLEGRIVNLRNVLGALQKAKEAADELASLASRQEQYELLRAQLQAARSIDAIAAVRQVLAGELAEWRKAVKELRQAAICLEELEQQRPAIEAERGIQSMLEASSEALLAQCSALEGRLVSWEQKEKLAKETSRARQRLVDIEGKLGKTRKHLQSLEDQKNKLALRTSWKDALALLKQHEIEISYNLSILIQARKDLDTVAEEIRVRTISIEQAEAELQTLSAALQKARLARDELAHRARQAQAAILAASLEEGRPCPVCGSEHHPHPASFDTAAPSELELHDAAQAYDLALQNHAACEQKLHNLRGTLSELLERYDQQVSLLYRQRENFLSLMSKPGGTEESAHLPADLFSGLVQALQTQSLACNELESLPRAVFTDASQRGMQSLEATRKAVSAVMDALGTASYQIQSAVQALGTLEQELAASRLELEDLNAAKARQENELSMISGQLQEAERQAGAEDPSPQLDSARKERDRILAQLKTSKEKVRIWEENFTKTGSILRERASGIEMRAEALTRAVAAFLDALYEHQVEQALALLQQANSTGLVSSIAPVPDTAREECEITDKAIIDLCRLLEHCKLSGQAENLSRHLASLSLTLKNHGIDHAGLLRLLRDLAAFSWLRQRLEQTEAQLRTFDMQLAKARQACDTRVQAYQDTCQVLSDILPSLPSSPGNDALLMLETTMAQQVQYKTVLAEELEGLRFQQAQLKTRYDLMQQNLSRLEELRVRYDQVRKQHAIISELSQLLNGRFNPERKLPFKFWVLNQHFCEIVEHA